MTGDGAGRRAGRRRLGIRVLVLDLPQTDAEPQSAARQ